MNFISECTSGGCGAKIGPGELSNILQFLPKGEDKNLLVGFDSSDDAAVYRISDEQAIISTTDFFSPMVDDPRTFGRIAATNAMSDVYAMGGDVLFALNLVCFPQKMDKNILAEILAGGAEKVLEAGAIIAGGHSIYDHETKYGLAVTGSVSPNKILRNNTCQAGDCLILTKALGVGLILSASRVDLASEGAYSSAIHSMQHLNKYAAQNMANYDVHACTDVTGFGLLVHASEMAGSEHSILIDTDSLPILPNALHYAEEYLATTAGQRNRNFMGTSINLQAISPAMQEILFDPQTSGGLLISVAAKDAQNLLDDIKKTDKNAAIIGTVEQKNNENIVVF